MTKKRFEYYEHKGADYILDTPNKSLDFIEMLGDCLEPEEIVDLLNELSDECDFLKIENEALEDGATKYAKLYHKSLKENKQLKKDTTDLMMVLKNQSIIIQELYSKLLEYELKEPKESIVLTKEGLEIMGKAISYYTHGRCGE